MASAATGERLTVATEESRVRQLVPNQVRASVAHIKIKSETANATAETSPRM